MSEVARARLAKALIGAVLAASLVTALVEPAPTRLNTPGPGTSLPTR